MSDSGAIKRKISISSDSDARRTLHGAAARGKSSAREPGLELCCREQSAHGRVRRRRAARSSRQVPTNAARDGGAETAVRGGSCSAGPDAGNTAIPSAAMTCEGQPAQEDRGERDRDLQQNLERTMIERGRELQLEFSVEVGRDRSSPRQGRSWSKSLTVDLRCSQEKKGLEGMRCCTMVVARKRHYLAFRGTRDPGRIEDYRIATEEFLFIGSVWHTIKGQGQVNCKSGSLNVLGTVKVQDRKGGKVHRSAPEVPKLVTVTCTCDSTRLSFKFPPPSSRPPNAFAGH
ncbi:hypothetical protein DFH06DRAFT_1437100 [Mycena polygramma]|nr:hypothetical protein DFH06DRAFT_1437100 [Mycena polygramma]